MPIKIDGGLSAVNRLREEGIVTIGKDRAMTIINNCDSCLYLGGQDVETARYIAVKANKTADPYPNRD